MELIDRKALLAEYDRVHESSADGTRKLMEDAPTVEARPVIHAYWEDRGSNSGVKCSNCKFHGSYRNAVQISRSYFDFCPHCGAVMDAAEGIVR